MKFRWSIQTPRAGLAAELARDLLISPLLAQCLLNREIEGPEAISRFLEPRLKHLADPFLLPNMAAAVDRLLIARQRDEVVVVFGDYDVDGVTATALLVEVLSTLGWRVETYLPDRLAEGYGLSREAVANCLQQFPTRLLLAVDCGSTATTVIAALQEAGIDVLVLDHHQAEGALPPAVAVVNPQLAAGGGPDFRELCSAGLAFKLAHALVKQGRQLDLPEMRQFDLRPCLDLVALGTIADLVPLRRENRILVQVGLERLNGTERPGLVALREVARVNGKIAGYEIGFQLAPRLNAAGRLETAREALRLLLTRDPAEARAIAGRLNAQNAERQQLQREITEEALATLRAKFNPETDFVIVEGGPRWHLGVVGIVASRILQEFYRPALILGGDGADWRGSGRSIEGFDLAAALRDCTDLLVGHGGHALAAGLALKGENLDALRDRLNELARRRLLPDQLRPLLRMDAEARACDLTLERVMELERLQQTGIGNPPVHLCLRGLVHHRPCQRLGRNGQHLKLWISDGSGECEALWWAAGNKPVPSGRFDLAVVPQVNEFRGNRRVQLKVLDWRPAP